MRRIQHFVPHTLAILGFILVALVYFYPVLQNKKIYQSDIVQYTGMAKELNDFRAVTGEESYWTNSAFGGMPTYQMGAKYPHHYIKTVDTWLRFLPRPADYLFLYFLGFYMLLCVLKIDQLKAFIGALAFGFSTYLVIILGVGHNAKAHAIAYMPMVLAGVILVFQKKYVVGGLLTMMAAALEIQANHFQMTYYLLLLLGVVAVFYIFQIIKSKDYQDLGKMALTFTIAGILALGANATSLLSTAEYAEFSTRGKNELTLDEMGAPLPTNNGLSYDYITEYSYGKAESLNLIAPRLFGGSNSESLDEKSEVYQYILSLGASPEQALDFAGQLPTYWGEQPIVAAPAYIGIVVFFFFVLAFFVENRKIKYAFLAGALISLLLSWGKNFAILTDFFIDNIPLYNKFRAVSSIQVILELCVPALAILGFAAFFKQTKEVQGKALLYSGGIVLGILVVLCLGAGFFDFKGAVDSMLDRSFTQMYDANFSNDVLRALRDDRKTMYQSDVLRSLGFVVVALGVLFVFYKDKLNATLTVIFLGGLMIFDLVLVDKKYVNETSFANAREVEEPFQKSPIDQEILKDDDLHYRVFEPQLGMSNARTSYFHNAIGGYSAVKPRRMQQLYDYHMSKGTMSVFNMLNVKYIIQNNQGKDLFSLNPFAMGNAWFVNEFIVVDSPDAEIKALENLTPLDSLDTAVKAIINSKDYPEIAKEVARARFFVDTSQAKIELKSYQPNRLEYVTNNSNEGVAVFSEMYYPKGWKVTIDGQEAKMFRVNYVLRAMQIPAGQHKIEFVFDPEVVKTGSSLTLASSILMLLLLMGGFYFEMKNKKSI